MKRMVSSVLIIAVLIMTVTAQSAAASAGLYWGPVTAGNLKLYMTNPHFGYAGPKVGNGQHINFHVGNRVALSYVPVANFHITKYRRFAEMTYCRAYFPEDEALAAGRVDFLGLPGIEVRQWDGMADCLEVRGPLSAEARVLLRGQGEREAPRLWRYEILEEDTPILRVEDFTLLFLFAADSGLKAMGQMGADANGLEPVDTQPKLGHGERVLPFGEDEVEGLREELHRTEGNEPED